MAYNEKIKLYYNKTDHRGSFEKKHNVGTGLVGAPSCGDVMKLQIQFGHDGTIEDVKYKTFGCMSAIASSALVAESLIGKTIDDACNLKNTDIADELGLPPAKIHCSVLAEEAIKQAVDDYKKKQLNQL
jgi:nitrogen fixation NifU-like protein